MFDIEIIQDVLEGYSEEILQAVVEEIKNRGWEVYGSLKESYENMSDDDLLKFYAEAIKKDNEFLINRLEVEIRARGKEVPGKGKGTPRESKTDEA